MLFTQTGRCFIWKSDCIDWDARETKAFIQRKHDFLFPHLTCAIWYHENVLNSFAAFQEFLWFSGEFTIRLVSTTNELLELVWFHESTFDFFESLSQSVSRRIRLLSICKFQRVYIVDYLMNIYDAAWQWLESVYRQNYLLIQHFIIFTRPTNCVEMTWR